MSGTPGRLKNCRVTPASLFQRLFSRSDTLRHRRYDPRLRLICELVLLPHIVCNRNRGCLGYDRKGDDDMEEKDEFVNRDIHQRDDARPADVKEEQSPEDGHCH